MQPWNWINFNYNHLFKSPRAIYNLKFVYRYLLNLDFCRQYCHILLGYNTAIRNFWYLVSYIFCFSFCLLFYLGGMFAVEKCKLQLLQLVKNNMHQTGTCFCDEFLWVVNFQIKHAKIFEDIWRYFNIWRQNLKQQV